MNLFNIKFNFFETKTDKFLNHLFKNEDVIFYMQKRNLTAMQIKHHYKELLPKFQNFVESPNIKKFLDLKGSCFFENDFKMLEPNIFFFFMLQYGSLFYGKRSPVEHFKMDEKTYHMYPNPDMLTMANGLFINQSYMAELLVENIETEMFPVEMFHYLAKKEDFKPILSNVFIFNSFVEKITKVPQETQFKYFENILEIAFPEGLDLLFFKKDNTFLDSYEAYQANKEKLYLDSTIKVSDNNRKKVKI
jgi:hypothetical protein